MKIKYALSAIVACAALMAGADNIQAGGENEESYRFVMVSHIGANDPNMFFFDRTIGRFQEKISQCHS